MSKDALSIWRRLGGGTEDSTTDNYAWVTYLRDTGLPQLIREEDQVGKMPFGHHQLCIFIEGDYK